MLLELGGLSGGPLQLRAGAGSPSAVHRAWKVWSLLELTVMLMILGAAVGMAKVQGKWVRLQKAGLVQNTWEEVLGLVDPQSCSVRVKLDIG